jgi:hypothetical protein
MFDFWRDSQEQWRVFKAIDRPGSVDPNTGDVSLKVLTRNLGKQFRDFDEISPSEIDTLPTRLGSTRELMKFARVARTFADSLPNSGTATRGTMRSLLSNTRPAKVLNRMLGLQRNLELATMTPERALELSR